MRAALAGVLLLGTACERGVLPCEGAACQGPIQVTRNSFQTGFFSTQVDLLFVIDDAAPLEPALVAYLPELMRPVDDFGPPLDLHVGIISSDPAGVLQNVRRGPTCTTARLDDPSARFLTFERPASECPAAVNFTGSLGEAFACHAAMDGGGSAFAQPLAALRAALAGCSSGTGCVRPESEGFLRPDALLVVVILTRRDDCSVPAGSTLLDPDEAQLGPLTPYRCFEYGALCGGAAPGREPGPREGCVAGSPDPDPRHQLLDVDEVASFLKGLTRDPRMVQVSVIAAPPAPVVVELDGDGHPTLRPSCTGDLMAGTPALRLERFVAQFDADRATYVSLCAADLALGLEEAFEWSEPLVISCLGAIPYDRDPDAPGLQPEAVVEDRRIVDVAAGVYEPTAVPPCEPLLCEPAPDRSCAREHHAIPQGAPGCWYLWPSDSCGLASGYEFRVDRGGEGDCYLPGPAATTTIEYRSCMDPADGIYDCSPGCAGYWPERCPGSP